MNSIHLTRKAFQRKILPCIFSFGNKVNCPYCGWHGWQFMPAGAANTPNRLCPRCGSLERYRMLLLYFQQEQVFTIPMRILDMAPRDCLTKYLQKKDNVTYISSDLNSPNAMVWSDLTKMGMASNSFDLIICSHIMEHINDDRAAFSELGRLLSPNGFGLLMVPLREGNTLEKTTTKPEENEKLFGRHDHVRLYGMDIVTRMESVGLQIETLDMFSIFGPDICQKNGLYGDDRYYFRFTKNYGH